MFLYSIAFMEKNEQAKKSWKLVDAIGMDKDIQYIIDNTPVDYSIRIDRPSEMMKNSESSHPVVQEVIRKIWNYRIPNYRYFSCDFKNWGASTYRFLRDKPDPELIIQS